MYQDWREGRLKPPHPEFPSPNDPYYQPKMLGWGAFYGALIAGTFTIPVGLLVRSPMVATVLVGGIWALYFAAQILCWHRYFFIIRPAQAQAKSSNAEAEAAQARLAELRAKNAADQAASKAALADYMNAAEEGREALKALWAMAMRLSDKKRVLLAHQQMLGAQKSHADELDLPKRFSLQAEAMRREAEHIRNLKFRF